MICPYCKSPNGGGQTHCSSCGGPLGGSGSRDPDYLKNPYAQNDLGSLKNPYAQKDLGNLKNPYSRPPQYGSYLDFLNHSSDPHYGRDQYDSNNYPANSYPAGSLQQNPYDSNPYAQGPIDRGDYRRSRGYRNGSYPPPDMYGEPPYHTPPPYHDRYHHGRRGRFGRGMTEAGSAAFMFGGFAVGWYYLLIYVVLFVSAIISLGTLPYYLSGGCFGKNAETWFSLYPQLHTWIYIYCGIRGFMAIWCILTRIALAHHSRYGPLMLHFLYLLNVAAPIVFMPVAYGLMGSEFSVGSAFAAIPFFNYFHSGISLLILLCNIPYFIKRRSIFIH